MKKRALMLGVGAVFIGQVALAGNTPQLTNVVRDLAEEHIRAITEGGLDRCIGHFTSRVIVDKKGKPSMLSKEQAERICSSLKADKRFLYIELINLNPAGEQIGTLKSVVRFKLYNKQTGYIDEGIKEIKFMKNGNGWYVVIPAEKL